MEKRNIILNIPHSSINGIFDENIGKWKHSPYFVNDCVNYLTDWWTDMIFDVNGCEYNKVVFPYSRFVCDAERLIDDPMEREGQGIIYTEYKGVKRGEISEQYRYVLMNLWKEHQKKLSSYITSNDSVLIDCHSFPSELSNTDICIGINDDWSYDEKIVNKVVDIFRQSGYSVSVNNPYSNSVTPESEYQYVSFMIEVNKRVYMNEKLLILEKNPRQWMRWNGCLKKIYNSILS